MVLEVHRLLERVRGIAAPRFTFSLSPTCPRMTWNTSTGGLLSNEDKAGASIEKNKISFCFVGSSLNQFLKVVYHSVLAVSLGSPLVVNGILILFTYCASITRVRFLASSLFTRGGEEAGKIDVLAPRK